jgi:hypothetical protein
MSTWRDLMALVLGWKTSPSAESSRYTAAGQVHVAGVECGNGRPAGQVHSSGPLRGQIHG